MTFGLSGILDMILIDSHCHLNFMSFDPDRDQVVQRARENGVAGILNPGIDLITSQEAIEFSEKYPGVYAAVGVHPNEATKWDDHTKEALVELSKEAKVIAIGEIGLDYYRQRASIELQKMIFQEQLQIARAVEMPVIIHTRNRDSGDLTAMRDVLDILEAWCNGLHVHQTALAERPGVLHSFSGDLNLAQRAIDMGFMIGFTGAVTFTNAKELQDLVAKIPVENILIETDAPFLAPHPYRGSRNEPAQVRLVADKIADIHNLDPEIVAKNTASNTERLFNWRVTF